MENNVEKEKVHKKVQSAIFDLPEKYRIPIHLKYVEGFELDAIADILKLNANTLRSIIKRGLEKISDKLKSENITMSSVGLIGLIETMPLEHAPVTVKSMAAKIMLTANSSRRVSAVASTKGVLLSTKWLAFLIAGSFFAVVGYIAMTQKSNSEAKKMAPMPTVKPEVKTNAPGKKDTNETWLGGNQFKENITFLIGKFLVYSTKVNSMLTEPNKPIFYFVSHTTTRKDFCVRMHSKLHKLIQRTLMCNYYFKGIGLRGKSCCNTKLGRIKNDIP